jgi:hypothetical protein
MEMRMKKTKLLVVAAYKINKKYRFIYYKLYQYSIFEYSEDDVVSSFVLMQKAGYMIKYTATETHILELDPYHATMVALYANSSISWEHEAMFSNLRLLQYRFNIICVTLFLLCIFKKLWML